MSKSVTPPFPVSFRYNNDTSTARHLPKKIVFCGSTTKLRLVFSFQVWQWPQYPYPSFRSRFNGCESGVGVLPRFWVRDRGGRGRLVVDFFRRSTFFVAGVSVTHPAHLTRLQIPNIVWCGVNLLLFFATSIKFLPSRRSGQEVVNSLLCCRP